MPRTIRFNLDENVKSAVAHGLRRLGADVTTTAEAGLQSTSDRQQLDYIKAEQRVIFTEDADFLRLHSQGESHPGIAYCHQQSRSIGQIVRGLETIWEVLEPEDMQNRLEYL